MSRGPRQSGSSAGGGQQQQNVRRGNKTLGWYLGGLVPGNNNGGGGGLEEAGDSKQQQAMRKSSLEDSSRSSPKFFNGDDQQQQQRRSQHLQMKQNRFIMSQQQQQANRPRANSSASAAKKPLTTTSNNNSNIGQHQLGQSGGVGQGQQQVDFHKSGGGGKPANGKENYWYYDPVSDGYYYEHNGTRGWRKRNAKLDAAVQAAQKGLEEVKVAEQQKKMAEASKAMMAQQQQSNVPSLLGTHQQQQQLGKLAAPPSATAGAASAAVPFGSPMAIKYFDSDGYFYEMASVDGWRRRQPGATPPNNSLASSLGAMPKAPSPIPAAAAVVPVHRRRIQPVQYQAYQQPPPHLNTVDLHEMVMLAQQQQQHHNGTGHGQHHQSCCANKTTQCCANSPAPACYCTIAALAAQMVLQKQQQMMAMKDVGGGVEALATEFGKSKALAMDSARPLFEGFSSKSGQFASFEPNHASRPAHPATQPFSLSANWEQYQPHNKWAPLSAGNGNGNASKKVCHNNQEEKTTSLPVGSFEEPYEFYWSGDEASCELAPPPNKSGGNIQTDSGIGISTTTTAASISSIDDDGLEEMMAGGQQETQKKPQQLQFIPPIGSEATKKGEEKRTKMRPDSLRLNCPKPMADAYVPISPGEIVRNPFGKENAANAMSFLPPQNFDVDKFIADLPPMPVNHEQILHSLRNPLRTPIGPPTAAAEPCTADSPLFTPIHLSKNPWTYRPTAESYWAYP